MNSVNWNLWHGCIKKSEGCLNCYVYTGDKRRNRDAKEVFKTSKFYEPIAKDRKGAYKHPSGSIFWTCFSSDFLLEQADEWRKAAFEMIKLRSDCKFFFITKRIERFMQVAPSDWGKGYDNVIVGVTAENQKRVDERLSIFVDLPIKHKVFIHEPLLEEIDINKYLRSDIEQVIAGGESGDMARPCNYDWILKIRQSCVQNNVTFKFKQTGRIFIKNGKRYDILRKYQHAQARRANINYIGEHIDYMQLIGKKEEIKQPSLLDLISKK